MHKDTPFTDFFIHWCIHATKLSSHRLVYIKTLDMHRGLRDDKQHTTHYSTKPLQNSYNLTVLLSHTQLHSYTPDPHLGS